MLIAQISDLHITVQDKKAYGVASTANNLARCVKHINKCVPRPDLVIVTGDITYSGLLEEARCAEEILEKLQYPYYVVPGNHDNRSTLWSVFHKHSCPCEDKDFINYVIEGHDIRLVGMDSSVPDGPGGNIDETGFNWLEQQLSADSSKPTILFMHHPPAKFRVLETDEDGFVGANRLAEVIAGYSNITAVLCGHIHLVAHTGWSGTVISTAPSMGLDLVLDLSLERASEFTLTSPAYQLHYFTADRNLITHTVFVQDTAAVSYLFKEHLE